MRAAVEGARVEDSSAATDFVSRTNTAESERVTGDGNEESEGGSSGGGIGEGCSTCNVIGFSLLYSSSVSFSSSLDSSPAMSSGGSPKHQPFTVLPN